MTACRTLQFLLALMGGTLFLAPAGAVAPSEYRGLYAIWSQNKPELLKLPFIKGGQVVFQWGDLEPQEEKYDFAPLEKALKEWHDLKMPATVQVNGNQKPQWLFKVVPHYPETLSTQVRDKEGCLMYWHPRHAKAYRDFIHAYGEFLKKCPYRSSVVGVRLNFNALGTEHFLSAKEKIDESKWVVPPGADRGPKHTPEGDNAYRTMVVQAFVDSFTPDIRIFVRNNLSPELRAPFESQFNAGKLGWFHTSSEIEPRSQGTQRQYQTFLDYCRTGKTLAYAESWADAWGRHGGKKDPRWCSPPQYNYWRLLCDLNCGVSCIAIYGADLVPCLGGKENDRYKDEFMRAYEFAAKYAGYHASPQESPGRWVAFREGDFLKGDYTFLAKRLPDNTRQAKNVGPEEQRYGAWARILPKGERMNIALDDAFATSLQGGKATVNITFYDKGNGGFSVQASGKSFPVKCEDSGKWRTLRLALEKPTFEKNAAGASMSIINGEQDITLHMVEVTRDSSR